MGLFDKAREQQAADAANPKVAEALTMANEKLRGTFGGSPIRALTEATEIGRSMQPEETLVTMVMGELDKKRGVVALTTQRIIFAEQSVTRNRMEVFALDEIDTVSMKGITNVKLLIGARRRVCEIEKTMPPGRAREFVEAHREVQLNRVRTTTSRPDTSPPDLATQLRQLAELHSSGALTSEQFEVAKERLLQNGS
jgi:hypothetical protein